MNARSLVLVGVLAAGLALIAWFLSGDDRSVDRGDPRTERVGAADTATVEAADLAAPKVETTAATQDSADARVAVEPEAESAARRTWPADETVWLEVHVKAPEGAEPGAEVLVLVLDDEEEYDDVFGGAGPLERIRGGADPSTLKDVLAAGTTTLGGSARLALPPGEDEAWIWIGGEYAYVTEGERLALDGEELRLDVTPKLGALVTGTLVAPTGVEVSLAGVEVELDWSINSFLSIGGAERAQLDLETRTAQDGSFAFRGVAVGGPQTPSTDDAKFARAFPEEIEPRAGEHVQLKIQLSEGAALVGRVVDEEGEPIAGAEVAALGRMFFGNPSAQLREGESGPDGRFRLEAVTAGKVWLRVEHDDYQEFLSDPWEVADGAEKDVGDVELGQGLSIAGTVTFPDGSPAEGASVAVEPDLGDNIAGSPVNPRDFLGANNAATVDADGAFTVRGLGEGPWALEVQLTIPEDAETEHALGRWTASQDGVAAPREGLALVLDEPVNLAGVVRRTDGEPVTAFEVHAERKGTQWYMPPSETASDEFESEDGTFLLTGLRAGNWTVWAEGDGYAKSAEVEVAMPTDEAMELTLQRPIVLAGVVLDPEGKPIVGAEVAKELEGTENFQAMQGRVDWPTAKSGDGGAFELLGMPPGVGSIVAKHDGFAASAPFAYELPEGGTEDEITLKLRRGGTISGMVYDVEGGPAKNCMVILQMPTMEERRMINADASGEFLEQGLTPGDWQVQAFPGIDSFEPEEGETLDQMALMKALKMTSVKLADEAEEHVVLGAPPADPVKVRGRVTVDGESVEESVVSFVSAGGKGMEAMKLTNTEDDGRYEVTLDEPGEYLVTVQTMVGAGRQNSVELRRTIPKAEELQLDLELPVGRLSGRVFGPDGKPVPGERVTLTMQSGQVFGTVYGGQYNELITDDDGAYLIEYLRPGTYVVAAGGSFLGGVLGDDGSQLGRVVRTVEVAEGEWLAGVDFRLTEPGSIHGTVRDLAGRPVEDAVIFLRDEEGRLVELFSFLSTNATGAFEYEGLAPGEYTITARTGELSSADAEPVRVRAGETTEAKVTVDTGTMLLVTLIDQTGADVVSTVSVVDHRGREMTGMLGLQELLEAYGGGLGSTERRVGPLAAGSYEVRCITADGREVTKSVKLSGQAERKVKLRLR